MVAHQPQEEGHEIDRAIEPCAEGEAEEASRREAALPKEAKLHDRATMAQAAPNRPDATTNAQQRKREHESAAPTALGPFLEQNLQAAEEERGEQGARIIELAQEPPVWPLAPQQRAGHEQDEQTWRQVDQEQPMPGPAVGDVAADHRTQRRRQHREDAGHRRRQQAAVLGKEGEAGCEHRGDDGPAAEALHGATKEEDGVTRAQRRAQARGRESSDGQQEEAAQGKKTRESGGEGDRDDLGDEIGGLHPAQEVERNAEGRLYVRQRAGDDLDVEDRHEHAEAHGEEPRPSDGTPRSVERNCDDDIT
jgi:hypothetical protein